MEDPAHIAIIMDGNRRWAKERGERGISGHRAGVAALDAVCREAAAMGLRYLTVYAFSTENWKRSAAEVSLLMGLLGEYLRRGRALADEGNIRILSIGDRSKLAEALRAELELTERHTAKNTGMTLIIALNYGGRDELVRAARALVRSGVKPEEITEQRLAACLDTAGIPDPDLMIRTSGECRLSNFLPWQLAYSELIFTPKYWPDFTPEDLHAAIDEYRKRTRRFGASDAPAAKA